MQVQANRVEGDEMDLLKNPGDFRWTAKDANGQPGRMMFCCPCGCGAIAGITVKPVAPNGWEWDGNLDKPTTKPSILIDRGHWHGYLTAGVFHE